METPKTEISYDIICDKMPIPQTHYSTYELALRCAKMNLPFDDPTYIVKRTTTYEICGIISKKKRRNRMNEEEAKLEAFTDFLNDIEQVAQKHGWNIGMYENLSDDKEFKRVEITFIPALGYDSQFRKF